MRTPPTWPMMSLNSGRMVPYSLISLSASLHRLVSPSIKSGWYVPYLFHNGCDSPATIIPTPIPRKFNPTSSWLNPWCPRMMGNAWKARYRMPRINAFLGRSLSEFPRELGAKGYPTKCPEAKPSCRITTALSGSQKTNEDTARRNIATHGKVGSSR